ncbi:MAG: hypothetical protein OXC55_05795, partial [Chloroflexi bacterium]|nr:hypothetical protein [Chloroflexota bacterium]
MARVRHGGTGAGQALGGQFRHGRESVPRLTYERMPDGRSVLARCCCHVIIGRHALHLPEPVEARPVWSTRLLSSPPLGSRRWPGNGGGIWTGRCR